MEPRPKTVEVSNGSGEVPAESHAPACPTVGRSYFFDLVVDFLPEDFLELELRELDLLPPLLFLAMALDLLS